MTAKPIDRDELRALVRQALRDALGEAASPLPVSGRPSPNLAPKGGGEGRRGAPRPIRGRAGEGLASDSKPGAASPDDFPGQLRGALAGGSALPVTVTSGVDLDRFARGILTASLDRDLKAAIESGRIRFELKSRSASAPPERSGEKGSSARPEAFRVESGVLGEASLVRIGRTHGKILVGSDVVVTPLARERARAMKVEIERRKP